MSQDSKTDRPQRLQSSRKQYASPGRITPPRRHTCVVFLDGSSCSEQALPYAMTFVRQSGANARIVLVASAVSRGRARAVESETQEYLRAVSHEVRNRTESQVTAVAIDSRNTAQSLCVAATDAALVVMASSNTGLLDRALHGRLSHQLVRRLQCPLLLVPRDAGQANLALNPRLSHVVIPVDGSACAERAVDAVAATGLASDAQCSLIHIHDMEQFGGRSLDDARAYLHGAASRARSRLLQVNTEFVIGLQRVAPALLSIVDEQRIDLIALATHARSGLASILKPSIAAQIVRRADIPVLLCGPASRVPTVKPVRAC